jgi:hypothetical protein
MRGLDPRMLGPIQVSARTTDFFGGVIRNCHARFMFDRRFNIIKRRDVAINSSKKPIKKSEIIRWNDRWKEPIVRGIDDQP